jgi:hypothetical protein
MPTEVDGIYSVDLLFEAPPVLSMPSLLTALKTRCPGVAPLSNEPSQVGDVIEDGHTVEGIAPGSKWRCRHEDALASPSRVVIDINPGPYAAGIRGG